VGLRSRWEDVRGILKLILKKYVVAWLIGVRMRSCQLSKNDCAPLSCSLLIYIGRNVLKIREYRQDVARCSRVESVGRIASC
jgi:hypothetical protein